MLFPRLFIGEGPGEAKENDKLDEDWAVVWTNEELPRDIAKLDQIPAQHYGGLRHKRGPRGGADWVYGYRVAKTWHRARRGPGPP